MAWSSTGWIPTSRAGRGRQRADVPASEASLDDLETPRGEELARCRDHVQPVRAQRHGRDALERVPERAVLWTGAESAALDQHIPARAQPEQLGFRVLGLGGVQRDHAAE